MLVSSVHGAWTWSSKHQGIACVYSLSKALWSSAGGFQAQSSKWGMLIESGAVDGGS